MKTEDIKELRKQLANLPKDIAGNEPLYAEFGQLCATKYIPQLLRAAGLNHETPEFDEKPCEMCYWSHQQVRMGCADCTNRSAFVSMFSPDAAVQREAYLKAMLDTK